MGPFVGAEGWGVSCYKEAIFFLPVKSRYTVSKYIRGPFLAKGVPKCANDGDGEESLHIGLVWTHKTSF